MPEAKRSASFCKNSRLELVPPVVKGFSVKLKAGRLWLKPGRPWLISFALSYGFRANYTEPPLAMAAPVVGKRA